MYLAGYVLPLELRMELLGFFGSHRPATVWGETGSPSNGSRREKISYHTENQVRVSAGRAGTVAYLKVAGT